jgi:hypothetical protein
MLPSTPSSSDSLNESHDVCWYLEENNQIDVGDVCTHPDALRGAKYAEEPLTEQLHDALTSSRCSSSVYVRDLIAKLGELIS